MPVVNALARELVFKVVYYGPGLGGKTTSLQHIYASTPAEHRGKMVSLATPVDRTLYFDFLPIHLPMSRDMTVRLQLFTVPGQVYYNATRKLVLTGADGVVFVVDSQRVRADASIESLRNLEENLSEHGRTLDEIPHVFSYNKRDLSELVPIDDMERLLNPHGAPSFATVATSGEGVYETLEAITRAVLEDFEQRMPEHRGLGPSPLILPEGGLTEALGMVEGLPDTGPSQPRSKRSASSGLSLSSLWSDEDRASVARVEEAIQSRDLRDAVLLADALVQRHLEGFAMGLGQPALEPTLVMLLLGVSGDRVLEFRKLCERSRATTSRPTEDEAKTALVFATNLRLLTRKARP